VCIEQWTAGFHILSQDAYAQRIDLFALTASRGHRDTRTQSNAELLPRLGIKQ
jgi:hypothetical protein